MLKLITRSVMLSSGALAPVGAPIRSSVVAATTAMNALSTTQVSQAEKAAQNPSSTV
jgi:hypothetical protein